MNTEQGAFAPVTESEMEIIRGYFSRAADAIVGVSKLGQEVASLHQNVDRLSKEVKDLGETNRFLVEQLTQARMERDSLRQELNSTSEAFAQARLELGNATRQSEAHESSANYWRTIAATNDRSRDEAELRAMEAEESVSRLKDKLAEAASWVSEINLMLSPPDTVVAVPISGGEATQIASPTVYDQAPKPFDYEEDAEPAKPTLEVISGGIDEPTPELDTTKPWWERVEGRTYGG